MQVQYLIFFLMWAGLEVLEAFDDFDDLFPLEGFCFLILLVGGLLWLVFSGLPGSLREDLEDGRDEGSDEGSLEADEVEPRSSWCVSDWLCELPGRSLRTDNISVKILGNSLQEL